MTKNEKEIIEANKFMLDAIEANLQAVLTAIRNYSELLYGSQSETQNEGK